MDGTGGERERDEKGGQWREGMGAHRTDERSDPSRLFALITFSAAKK